MGRCSGRAWAHAAIASLTFSVSAAGPTAAFGQDGEEVIADPELSGGKSGRSGAGANGDETIADPELSGGSGGGWDEASTEDYGWGSVYTPKTHSQNEAPPAPEEEEYDPLANTGVGSLQVIGQQVFDTEHNFRMEDFYETRLRMGGEVDFRLSRKLRLSFGARIDFLWAAPHQDDPDLTIRWTDAQGMAHTRRDSPLDQDRYEIDVIPLSAYADWTAGEGVHFRFGEQVVSLGRMDGFSVVDMLVVRDYRPGPTVNPSSLKLAQPAVRLDWDMSSWATLQAVYVPWFMPDLSRPNRDRYIQAALTGYGLNDLPGAPNDILDPSYQTRATEGAMRLVAPPPDFRNPQAEVRLNMRGHGFELALLGGTALEKLPSVYYIPMIDQMLRGAGSNGALATPTQLAAQAGNVALLEASGYRTFDVEYPRYYLAGLDGSFDIAPLQVGFEFGFSPERHLYAATTDGSSLPLPNVSKQICNPTPSTPEDPHMPPAGCSNEGNVKDRSIRKGVPVVLAALHVEWLKGESFVMAAEAYMMQALQLPYDKKRDWLGAIPNTGTFVGGLMTGSYALDEGRWHVDATVLLTPGPSALLVPQIELRVHDGLYLNVGAQFYEGPAPRLQPGLAGRNLTFGGLYNRYDNVYLGFRWLPGS